MAERRDHDAAGGDPGPEELERQWQEIIAGLGPLGAAGGDDADAQPRPGSRRETGDEGAAARAGEAGGIGGRGALPPWHSRDDAEDEVDEDEGDFVPPEPPALGSGNPAVVLSMVGVAGAPVALLLTAVVWPSVPGAVLAVLVAAFVAGAVGLFFTLPRDADRDGPGDDGARV